MIFANKKINLTPNSAPLGSKIPHAAGYGYFYRTQNQDKVCLGVMGDGSASEGDFHAGMNFASTLGS